MILSKEVKLSPRGKSIKHYKKLGYLTEYGKTISVKIEDLPSNSHTLINVKCDICGTEKQLEYVKYIKNTKNFSLLYCCRKCATKKIKNTCLEKHGIENYVNPDKGKKTKFDEYGDENYNNRKKSENTCLIKYGVKHVSQNEKVRKKKIETCLRNHGVEYSFQSSELREKTKQTCLNKYGVEHHMQNAEIFNKAKKSGYKIIIHEQTGLSCQGTYELDFADYCFKNSIKIEKCKSIEYTFKDKIHIHHPDFYCVQKNLIIDVKSKHYYELHLDKNISKQKAAIEQGFLYIFIIDKNYNEFKTITSS